MFDLKKPCNNCPFRKDKGAAFRLPPDRIREIAEAPAFHCHKTVDYSHYEDRGSRAGDKPQQCAGLMAILHKQGQPNQIMRLAERTGHLDPDKLDPDGLTYGSVDEAITGHNPVRSGTVTG